MIQNFAGMLLRWSPFKFMVQSSKVAYSAYTNIYKIQIIYNFGWGMTSIQTCLPLCKIWKMQLSCNFGQRTCIFFFAKKLSQAHCKHRPWNMEADQCHESQSYTMLWKSSLSQNCRLFEFLFWGFTYWDAKAYTTGAPDPCGLLHLFPSVCLSVCQYTVG
jgi:hypothetical protein